MAEGNIEYRIHKLPDNLVNQIAAGEVIERPASVVKELLENSLDAGAAKITLEIKGGGSRLIKVIDNGHGIHADDLLLAVDRHTTSKLHDSADLFKIATLGFRGEALSSIASVSRLKIVSRQQTDSHGWAAVFESVPDLQPAAHPVGTTVEVRDLFYNTPARRKFLRTEKTESLHIHELVKRIILSRFDLDLRFLQDDRQVLLLADSDPHYRISSVLGRQFLNRSVTVEQQLDDMSLHGWVGLPETARSQADRQYFYLNGRIIKDKLVNHAVRMAYEDLLHPGRHPSYLLYLVTDFAAADINVHPTKHEVRFRETRKVHDFIYGSVSRLLRENRQQDKQIHISTAVNSRTYSVREGATGYANSRSAAVSGEVIPDSETPLTHINNRFLVTGNSDGIILYDMYRMRELITCIRLTQELNSGAIKSRPLLVPLMLPVTYRMIETIDANMALFEKCGLLLQQISPETMQIRTLPVALPYADTLALVKDIITILDEKKNNIEFDRLLQLFCQHANDFPPAKSGIHELNSILRDFNAISNHISEDQFNRVLCRLDQETILKLIDEKNG